ncbi:isopentenyl-diphosphate Delta-isomerase [Dinghuibacter silviterrae]|uniref:Isopentenyl-diphosphate delta-isomerase n=1 Tax=Dinghuibacter silviterrae TaxID=1539049 RepID=A0A4R8DPQ2_9BACT|nr:isopentenyl-diphosphate Delta-isomerase [Dinghuibacter silviterrae]TDX00074.1 isopentenyl-diphosphate delta-isomerase [Dinghuibacter silviterrae]
MQQVVLVDELDREVGVMEKLEAHRKALLHRAFSVFIFNARGAMLLQKRAAGKYHSGGLWTNACCSHPAPGETVLEAGERRLREELGFSTPLTKAFDFIYKTAFDNGLTEYEFDHVFIGVYDGPVWPDPTEVDDYQWVGLEELKTDLDVRPGNYTEWFKIALQAFLGRAPLDFLPKG